MARDRAETSWDPLRNRKHMGCQYRVVEMILEAGGWLLLQLDADGIRLASKGLGEEQPISRRCQINSEWCQRIWIGFQRIGMSC